MKGQVRVSLLLSISVLVLSCTCALLGPSLSESRQIGGNISVNYPEDWYAIIGYAEVTIFSPDVLDRESWIDNPRSPYFLVISLEDWFDQDWYRDIADPEDLLDEFVEEFELGVRNIETLESGDISWTRGFFGGPIFGSSSSFEGWIAVENFSQDGTLIIAAAPDDDWDEYDGIFEAMLRSVEIAD